LRFEVIEQKMMCEIMGGVGGMHEMEKDIESTRSSS
jgi:hypothetical protein